MSNGVALNLVRHRMETTVSTDMPPTTEAELNRLLDEAALLIRTIDRAEKNLLATAANQAVVEHMRMQLAERGVHVAHG